ncbi:hypothetical protein F4809DRAFT_617030 [Biscogniauxia mediterranea]|nr:hypothetical protein F4809DRAFT_617030 [Biscogniauxia mediterranea]
MIPHRGGARIPIRRLPIAPSSPQSPESAALTNEYETSPSDCVETKRILAKASGFPPEIVDIVMDFAEYWVCSVSTIDYTRFRSGHHTITGGRSPTENEMLLRTPPLGLNKWRPASDELWRAQATPRPLQKEYAPKQLLKDFAGGPKDTLEHPCRKIVFDITSRDQGFGGLPADRNTYRHSFTWFDAGLDRFDASHECPQDCKERANPQRPPSTIPTCAIRPAWPPLNENATDYHHELYSPPDRVIQRNKTADAEWQHHHVEWSLSDSIDPESTAGQDLESVYGRGAATANGKFVRDLKIGDMVTVWGRARFGAWKNMVKTVTVRVYWSV